MYLTFFVAQGGLLFAVLEQPVFRTAILCISLQSLCTIFVIILLEQHILLKQQSFPRKVEHGA